MRALADGAEFARHTVTVGTVSTDNFLRGRRGDFVLPHFPQAGQETAIRWEESLPNFGITGAE